MDRLTAIGVFVQVVERKSFSGAARHFGIGVSTVSKHIAHLEAWIGAKLLQRSTRRLSVTEAGGEFYQRCTRIVAELEEAELAAKQLHGTPQGVLRVNAPLTFGVLYVVPLILDFVRSYPRVRVDLTLNDRPLDPIAGGFDVTVRIVAALPDSTFIARKLAPNRLVVCGSPGYLARQGAPASPQDLARHSCLSYTQLHTPWTWRFGRHGETSVVVSGVFQANSGDALRDAAIAGLGLVQLPLFIVGPALRAGTLRAVLEDHESPESSIYAMYSPGRVPAKVKAFADFLATRIGRHAEWGRLPPGGRGRAGTTIRSPSRRRTSPGSPPAGRSSP